MREFLATLRRRPAPLIGTFVALAMAALLVTATTIFIGTGITLSAPAQRLAGTTLVVTGNPDVRVTSGAGDNVETDVLPLPDYRRVPLGLANGLASVDGVAAAVPDVSFPVALEPASGNVATGTAAEPYQAHGWASAALTPFRLTSGHAPTAADQIVLGSGVAASTRLRIGSAVRLAGQDLPRVHGGRRGRGQRRQPGRGLDRVPLGHRGGRAVRPPGAGRPDRHRGPAGGIRSHADRARPGRAGRLGPDRARAGEDRPG